MTVPDFLELATRLQVIWPSVAAQDQQHVDEGKLTAELLHSRYGPIIERKEREEVDRQRRAAEAEARRLEREAEEAARIEKLRLDAAEKAESIAQSAYRKEKSNLSEATPEYLQQELLASKASALSAQAGDATECAVREDVVEFLSSIKTHESLLAKHSETTAELAQAIADIQEAKVEIQKDLDLTLPDLDAAFKGLSALRKVDVHEIRALRRPPDGIVLALEALCIMFQVSPIKVRDPNSGAKIDDYLDPSRRLICDGRLLQDMLVYDKDNIPQAVIHKIQRLIDRDDFNPEALHRVSLFAASICMWVRAMYSYHWVSQKLAPQKKLLHELEQVPEQLHFLAEAFLACAKTWAERLKHETGRCQAC